MKTVQSRSDAARPAPGVTPQSHKQAQEATSRRDATGVGPLSPFYAAMITDPDPHEEAIRQHMEELRKAVAASQQDGMAMLDTVLRDRRLSASAKLVYKHLFAALLQGEWQCPGKPPMAKDLGMSRRTVVRALSDLHDHCYIEVWHRGLGKTNVSFINPLSFITTSPPRVRWEADAPRQGPNAVVMPPPHCHITQ